MTRARKGEQSAVPEKVLTVEHGKNLCRKHEAFLLCAATTYKLCNSPAATVLKDVGKAAKCKQHKEVLELLGQALEKINKNLRPVCLNQFAAEVTRWPLFVRCVYRSPLVHTHRQITNLMLSNVRSSREQRKRGQSPRISCSLRWFCLCGFPRC